MSDVDKVREAVKDLHHGASVENLITYLQQDVKDRMTSNPNQPSVRYTGEFKRAICSIAQEQGDYEQLGQDLGVTVQSIRSWMKEFNETGELKSD